jgi:hypothetical protein
MDDYRESIDGFRVEEEYHLGQIALFVATIFITKQITINLLKYTLKEQLTRSLQSLNFDF